MSSPFNKKKENLSNKKEEKQPIVDDMNCVLFSGNMKEENKITLGTK